MRGLAGDCERPECAVPGRCRATPQRRWPLLPLRLGTCKLPAVTTWQQTDLQYLCSPAFSMPKAAVYAARLNNTACPGPGRAALARKAAATSASTTSTGMSAFRSSCVSEIVPVSRPASLGNSCNGILKLKVLLACTSVPCTVQVTGDSVCRRVQARELWPLQ
jgi:hypothetical protein